MKIEKYIPARTIIYKIDWCQRDFTVYNKRFREIREKLKHKMNCCFLCDVDFKDNEIISLACFIDGARGNKVLCISCADKILLSAN